MVGHDRIAPLISKLLNVWVTILVMVMVVGIKPFGSAATTTKFHVNPATGRIHDSFGRERIFHGLNVVVKGAPWHPRVDAFDPQSSFTDEDIALLQEWGMNVVRLGIMWPGVEPSRGHVNSTYLEVMRSIVSKLHSAGIYALLEFHQDLYASQFCGEGLPSWILDDNDLSLKQPLVHVHQRQNPSPSFLLHFDPLDQNATNSQEMENHHNAFTNNPPARSHGATPTQSSSSSAAAAADQEGQISSRKPQFNHMVLSTKMRYPASFPEPLGRRWPWPSEWQKDGWEPPIERCNTHVWWLFYLSYAVSRAFQDLYDNKWGWGELLAGYWTVVARAFKDQPGVLGYELMNEPWPGDVFSNPLLFLPGVADKKNLAPFYEKLQAAVRSVDRERILFFETITFDNFRCGWSTVPGGAEWQNKTVLSYHYYTPPNFSAKQAFAERSRESKRLGCGSMLTEFFVSTEKDRRDQHEFRKARRDLLRTALRTEVLNPEPRADKEALFCDPAEKGSSQVTCSKKRRRASEEDLESTLTGVKEEEIIQAKGRDVTNNLRSSQGKPLVATDRDLQKKSAKEVDSVDEVLSPKPLVAIDKDLHKKSAKEVDSIDEVLSAKPLVAIDRDLQNESANEVDSVDEVLSPKPLVASKALQKKSAKDVDSVDEVLSAADTYGQSWIGWEYKAFFHKTGSIAEQSLFGEDGEVDLILAKKLSRTYPQSVCGSIISFTFDIPSSLFSLSYVAGRDCMTGDLLTPTEIFVQREFYYPHGLLVEVTPPCASFTETNRIVQVKHNSKCFGYVIDVRIIRVYPVL